MSASISLDTKGETMDEDLSSTQPACVVLGLGVNGLGVVRSLGRRNISCYGVSSSAADVGGSQDIVSLSGRPPCLRSRGV